MKPFRFRDYPCGYKEAEKSMNHIPDYNEDEQSDRAYWSEWTPTEAECARCHHVRQRDDLDYDQICLGCREIMDMEYDAQHQLTYSDPTLIGINRIMADFDKRFFMKVEVIPGKDL